MGQKLFVILINTVKSLKGWLRKIHQGIRRRPVFGQTIYNESPWAKEEQLSQKIRNTVWSDRGGFPHSAAAAYLARAALGPRVPDKQLQQRERGNKSLNE